MEKIKISIELDKIIITSNNKLPTVVTKEIQQLKILENNKIIKYECILGSYNSFVLFAMMKHNKSKFEINEDDFKLLIEYAKQVKFPTMKIKNQASLELTTPNIRTYIHYLLLLEATNQRLLNYRVPFGRLYEAYRYIKHFYHPFLPPFFIDKETKEILHKPLIDNPTLDNLFKIELKDLITIRNGWKINIDGFKNIKYNNAADLLLNRPRGYQDRIHSNSFKEIPFGQKVQVKAKVKSVNVLYNDTLILNCEDFEGKLFSAKFFGKEYLKNKIEADDIVYILGSKYTKDVFTALDVATELDVRSLPIAPIYKQSKKNKITTRVLTNSVYEMFNRLENCKDLCSYIKTPSMTFWEALKSLHFPDDEKEYIDCIETLAFIELVFMQLMFIDKKENSVEYIGLPKDKKKNGFYEQAKNVLPFELTKDQINALSYIESKMSTNLPESLLLSADVGAGKSIIGFLSSLNAVDNNYQVAIFAPTEILAQQLYRGLDNLIQRLEYKPKIAFLSGSSKAKEKTNVSCGVKTGDINIVVGTHSIFNLEFKNLGFIVLDEEQKIGTEHKNKLLYCRKDKCVPDVLSQTATPIPRTTAKAFYGDLDLITMETKPTGRKEIITKWIKQDTEEFFENQLSEEWSIILGEIEKGKQVFVVAPLVIENENIKAISVEKAKKKLKSMYPNLSIDTISGDLKKEEQEKRMKKFRDNKTQILISSTIIEVGVDIPNATVMLVLDADRFGVSSLHQIRGRVGRNKHQSYCFLISGKNTQSVSIRLNSLVNSNNGFEIALVDLDTRREGDIFGVKQSGDSRFKFCDLTDHSKMIDVAREEAYRLYNDNTLKEKALEDAKVFLRLKEEE